MGAKLPVLSVDDLGKVLDLEEKQVDVPQWGASVKIRAFTVEERDAVVSQCSDPGGAIDGRKLVRLLVAHGVVDPKFSLEQVSRMPFVAVDQIANEIMSLNGMTKKEGASAATVADVTFRPES
jgi:hypothetical protein